MLALTQTFAAVDWIMGLDPYWYSTIFGVYWFAGSFVSFFALVTLMVVLLRRNGLMTDVVGLEHFHDLGKLLFAFTVFWAYIGFSQYFLIWYGNIPEETIILPAPARGLVERGVVPPRGGTFRRSVLFLHAADDQAEARAPRSRGGLDAADARRRYLLAGHAVDAPRGGLDRVARRFRLPCRGRGVRRRFGLDDAGLAAGPGARPPASGIAVLRELLM